MGKWQSKILFTLILYAAGFVTAVYLLAPCPVQAADNAQDGQTQSWSQQAKTVIAKAQTSSPEWALKIRSGIDACIDFAEEHALQAADLIRSKMGQGKTQNDG